MKKDLPIGIQVFPQIIERNNIYVDKTKLIYQLMSGSVYFLSRPRRFGKSLLISTLEALFQGRRELFNGLWIDQSDYDWKAYPVIRLDMSILTFQSIEELEGALIRMLHRIANEQSISLPELPTAAELFQAFIVALSHQNSVVILIDEYDKPILDHLTDIPYAKQIRDTLKSFYSVLKANQQYLRFIFLTGVSRFSKVSIFSGLNNLDDITMNAQYATLCGYTQSDLIHYFQDRIDEMAVVENISTDLLLDQIKEWYNGFLFAGKGESVYNPFSILKFFSMKEFGNYWYETGTPTFLINLIEKGTIRPEDLDNREVGLSTLGSFELENLDTDTIMVQAGYLTISEQIDLNTYRLAYPNKEVSYSFTVSLLRHIANARDIAPEVLVYRMRKALNAGNLDEFITHLSSAYAQIPSNMRGKNEKYYHSIFHMLMSIMEIKPQSEVNVQFGRLDTILETPDRFYLIEFKYNKSAEAAINQIKEKQYFSHLMHLGKPVHLVGINFESRKRNVGAYLEEIVKSNN